MVDGLAVVDLHVVAYLRVNAAMCRMLGYAEEELRTLTVRDLHPAEALPQVLAGLPGRRSRHAKAITKSVPCLHKDGSVLYVDIGTVTIVPKGRAAWRLFSAT